MGNKISKHLSLNWIWLLGYFVLLGLISIRIGQDVNYDLRNYHFYNPYSLINGRLEYDIMAANEQSFLNPLLDIPFFIAVYYLNISPVLIVFILGGIHGINTWLIHNLVYFSLRNSANLYKKVFSTLAALTSVFGAGYLSELGATMNDNIISIFVLTSLLILNYSFAQNKILKWQNILLSGFILGCGVGLKLTAAIYAVALVVGILSVGNNIREKFLNALIISTGILCGFFFSAGYWIIQMWRNFSSPLFPFYNDIFHSPYARFERYKDGRFSPQDIWQHFLYPFYFIRRKYSHLVAEVDFSDVRLAIVYIIIVIFIIFFIFNFIRSRKTSTIRVNLEFIHVLLPFFVISYILWQETFSIYRYVIPLELLSPVLVIGLLGYILPSPKSLLWICLAIFTIMILTVKPLNWGRINKIPSSYFGIEKQSLLKYNKSIILTSYGPNSFVIPYFPSNSKFIGISNYIPKEGLFKNTLMEKKIKNILQNPKNNNIYLLYLLGNYENKNQNSEKEFLKNYNLGINYKDCNILKTYVDSFNICKIKKID